MALIQQNITAFWIGTTLKGNPNLSETDYTYSRLGSLIKRYFLNKY